MCLPTPPRQEIHIHLRHMPPGDAEVALTRGNTAGGPFPSPLAGLATNRQKASHTHAARDTDASTLSRVRRATNLPHLVLPKIGPCPISHGLAVGVLWGEECSMERWAGVVMPGRRIGARQFGGRPLKLQWMGRAGVVPPCLRLRLPFGRSDGA